MCTSNLKFSLQKDTPQGLFRAQNDKKAFNYVGISGILLTHVQLLRATHLQVSDI